MLFGLPYTTHTYLLPHVTQQLTFTGQIATRTCKLISTSLQHTNAVIKYVFLKAANSFCGIIRKAIKYLKDRYNIERIDIYNYKKCKQIINCGAQWQNPTGVQLGQLLDDNIEINGFSEAERMDIIYFICTD